jgi:hypothetical protein
VVHPVNKPAAMKVMPNTNAIRLVDGVALFISFSFSGNGNSPRGKYWILRVVLHLTPWPVKRRGEF